MSINSLTCFDHDACGLQRFCDGASNLCHSCMKCAGTNQQVFSDCKERCTVNEGGSTTFVPPDVSTKPLLLPGDDEQLSHGRTALLTAVIIITIIIIMLVIVVAFVWFLCKKKIKTHIPKLCKPCKPCCSYLCQLDEEYGVVPTMEQGDRIESLSGADGTNTIRYHRGKSTDSQDSAYDTGESRTDQTRKSLTDKTFASQTGIAEENLNESRDIRTSVEGLDEGNNDGETTTSLLKEDIERYENAKLEEPKTDVPTIRQDAEQGKSEPGAKIKQRTKPPKDGDITEGLLDKKRNEERDKRGNTDPKDGNKSNTNSSKNTKPKTKSPKSKSVNDNQPTHSGVQPNSDAKKSESHKHSKPQNNGKNMETDGKPCDKKTDKKTGTATIRTGEKDDKPKPVDGKSKDVKPKGATSDTSEKTSQQPKQKPSVPTQPTKDPSTENRLQLDLFSNVFIPKEEPRTTMGDTNKAGVETGGVEREHAAEEMDAPLSIECTEDPNNEAKTKERPARANTISPPTDEESFSRHPSRSLARPPLPSVRIVDGGQSHRESVPLPSRFNDSGCGSVGGAVGGVQASVDGRMRAGVDDADGARISSMTASEEFRKMTERHMAERGVGEPTDRGDEQLAFPQQVSDRDREAGVMGADEEEVRRMEQMFPGFIHPSKQRNRWIYEQLKTIDWVMGYYSAGESIEVYVNLGSLDPHVVEQQLVDITGADITKFHVKQNEQPEFDYNL